MSPIAHGIDLVEVKRIEQMLNDHGARFLERVFTLQEREYALSGGVSGPQRLAARFAAKEAAFKAIGTGLRSGMNWTDVEVSVNAAGAPSMQLHGRPAEIARGCGISHWLVSLSHSGGFAIASVIGVANKTGG